MTLPITITKTEQVELKVPCFYKEKGENKNRLHYVAVLNEETAISLVWIKDYTSIVNGKPEDLGLHLNQVTNGSFHEVSEEEFLSYYEDTLAGLSLRPKLETSFVGDLETVGLNRKEAL